VEYLLRKHPGSKNIVIFDSINSLAIHNSTEILSEFLHIMLNNLKSRGVLSILLATADESDTPIDRLLTLVSDETFVVRARETSA
jgi:archaellum biogenesis ATPase FlaH